jgi:hypothetical protein
MNIRGLQSALILGAFLFSPVAKSSAEELVGAADVAFANGMDTALVEAVSHLSSLITDLHRDGHRWNDGRHAILLYHVGSFAKNLQEVIVQKEDEASNVARSKALSRAYFLLLSNHPNYEDPDVLSLVSEARDPAENLRARMISSMTPAATVDREVSDDASKLRFALKRGGHVLLVSHSQGNLYSNQAVSLLALDASRTDDPQRVNLEELGRLHVVGVAVPASYVVLPGIRGGSELRIDSNYMTSDNDHVISALSVLTKISALDNPLPANTTISRGQAPKDTAWLDWFLGHGFKTTYIAPAGNTVFLRLVHCALEVPRVQCAPPQLSNQQVLDSPADPHFKGKGIDSLDDGPVALRHREEVSYPSAQIESVLERYPDKSTQQAAREFASDLWTLWRKTSGMKVYDKSIEGLELDVIGSEFKLLGEMRVNLPEQSEDQLLADIQSTLTATPRVFGDYVNADRLVSGHPIDIEVDKYDPNFGK